MSSSGSGGQRFFSARSCVCAGAMALVIAVGLIGFIAPQFVSERRLHDESLLSHEELRAAVDVVTAVAAVGGLLVGAPLIALALARAHRERLLGAHLGVMVGLLTVFSFSWLIVSDLVVGGRGPGGGAYSENWDAANKFGELMATAPCFAMLIVGLLFTIGAAWRRGR